MQQQLLPTGRVSYFPMTEYLGDTRIRRLSGEEITVNVRRRVVDSTFMRVVVPSMRRPPYAVAAAATCIPLNDLPKFRSGFDRYVIIGAGKTGMDACLWLLRQGVAADKLTWIMPRDSWLLDRANIQPGPQFADPIRQGMAMQAEAIAGASSLDDLFARLESTGRLQRLDPAVRPTMYRCATVTRVELELLRSIKDVVRLGHVQRIEPEAIVLDRGTVRTGRSTLYVDCTADGLERRPGVPVFGRDSMTLQTVRACQQVFSAAFIAHVEAAYDNDAIKNDLCEPAPHPDTDLDWLTMTHANNRNTMRWLDDQGLMTWLDNSRLDLLGHLRPRAPKDPAQFAALAGQIKGRLGAANDKLSALLEQAQSAKVAFLVQRRRADGLQTAAIHDPDGPVCRCDKAALTKTSSARAAPFFVQGRSSRRVRTAISAIRRRPISYAPTRARATLAAQRLRATGGKAPAPARSSCPAFADG